jgi:Na+-transporting NADH:ubiquinone oxidoreductase subunit A
MRVEEGDSVKLGQPLFADRRHPELVFTSPGSGVVKRINRGARRALLSVVVELDGDEEETFPSWSAEDLGDLRRYQVTDILLASGQWAALRTRPFNKVPIPGSLPSSIFVTATDTNPLAAKATVVIDEHREDFVNGLTVVSHLTEGRVFVCHAPGADMPTSEAANVSWAMFAGPHPSGLVGSHIHFLDPVGADKVVWHLGYQDVIALGKLFTTGRLWVERVAALAGPVVKRPRLIRTRLGAGIDDITRGELHDVDCRVVSGSLLSGHHAEGALAFLGRYHNQVSVIAEGSGKQPSSRGVPYRKDAFSAYRIAVTLKQRRRKFDLTTAAHGRATVMMPLGGFERVMPLDILPTQLLRALLVGDTDMAQALGCLELDEEDLALCTFVCPGKIEYGPLLRACLERIEKEG